MSVHGPLGVTPQSGAFDVTRPLGARASTGRTWAGNLGLAGLLVTGLVISLSAASTDALLPESIRPVPGWLAGPFGSAGLNLGVAPLVFVLMAMFACYVVAISCAERLSPRAVLMSIAALHALVLLAAPMISTDVFSYQAYARMWALYGANPYVHGPHAIALDPLYPFIGARWVSTPTAYGPVFTIFSSLLAPLSIAAGVLAYKAIAAVASLVVVALVWNAARLRGLDPVRAGALVGLNPLIVIYGVGGGHNDLLMVAALMAAIYFVLAHRDRVGGGMLAVAAGIKLTAGLCAPFALLAPGGLGGRSRRRNILVGAAAVTALLAAVSFAVFGAGPLNLLATLQHIQNRGDWHSIPGFISTRLGLGPGGHVAGVCLGIVFVAAFAWLLREVARGRMDWIDGAAWATAAMLMTASSMLPWYVAWLIPLVALGTDRRLWRTALIITGVVQGIQLLGYIPHASPLLRF